MINNRRYILLLYSIELEFQEMGFIIILYYYNVTLITFLFLFLYGNFGMFLKFNLYDFTLCDLFMSDIRMLFKK